MPLDQEIERYRGLFYSSPAAGLVFDRSSLAILAANAAATALYGYTTEEILARTMRDLFREGQAETFEQKLLDKEIGCEITGPWQHARNDGAPLYVELTLQPHTMQGRTAVIAAVTD